MSDRVVQRVNGGPLNCLRKELRELGGTMSLQDPENEGKKKKKPSSLTHRRNTIC